MAEGKEGSQVKHPHQPQLFLEVLCKSSGKIRRFSEGTEAGFAVNLINKKLINDDVGGNGVLASHIEAVKEGEEEEEAVSFGPTSLLVDYGSGWKLQTVIESPGERGGRIGSTRVRKASANDNDDPHAKRGNQSPLSFVYIGMDESGENNRVKWNNPEVDKCFLEACIQEVALNGREGGSLKVESWINVMNILKKNHNFVVCQRQMKNRFDYLKKKYQAWLLLTTKTGNVYNHATNTINMTKDEWTKYVQAHPKAKSLRFGPLPFPNLCRTLFDGATATGFNSSGPSSQDQVPVSTIRKGEQSLAEELLSDEDIAGTQNNESIPISQKERPKKRKKRKPTITKSGNLINDMSAALKFMIKNNSGPSVTDGIAKFDELGWGKED